MEKFIKIDKDFINIKTIELVERNELEDISEITLSNGRIIETVFETVRIMIALAEVQSNKDLVLAEVKESLIG